MALRRPGPRLGSAAGPVGHRPGDHSPAVPFGYVFLYMRWFRRCGRCRTRPPHRTGDPRRPRRACRWPAMTARVTSAGRRPRRARAGPRLFAVVRAPVIPPLDRGATGAGHDGRAGRLSTAPLGARAGERRRRPAAAGRAGHGPPAPFPGWSREGPRRVPRTRRHGGTTPLARRRCAPSPETTAWTVPCHGRAIRPRLRRPRSRRRTPAPRHARRAGPRPASPPISTAGAGRTGSRSPSRPGRHAA